MKNPPHLALVPLVGFRVREDAMRALGMELPGLHTRSAALAQLPALGLLTLAGATPDPWTLTYDPVIHVDDALVERIAAQQPALVAVSALTASIEEAYRLCGLLKARGISTVIGGLHVSACPAEASRHADAVVIGPGENVWPQLLQDAQANKLAPRYDANGAFPRFSRQATWPRPRFDLLGDAPPRFTLQTQRGCPLACDFCGASRLLGGFSEKPLEAVAHELEAICALSPRPLLELADDNTFAGKRDPAPLLEVLRRSGARWFTECDWRIGERPELLAHLAASGCRQILIGVESLVFRYPGQGQKLAELARVMNAIEAMQEAGIVANGCFIVGADGETRHSLDRLAEFILASPLAEVQITLQTPFPGTGLYRRLRDAKRLLPERGWSHYTLFDVAYRPETLSVNELEAGFKSLLRSVYAAGPSRRRDALRRKIWESARRKRLTSPWSQ